MYLFLSLFSFFHCIGSALKNTLYRIKICIPKKAPLPVISVGNISLGGSEKTPLVMNLLSFLLKQGYRPALVSRGYRGKWERCGGILSDGEKTYGTWRESGDEPFMVAQNIPRAGIFIGKNRLLSCQKAKDSKFELAVLDDGFQHYRLHRDLDIVLHTPEKKAGLREFPYSLRRAHIILVKKCPEIPLKKQLINLKSHPLIFKYTVVNKGFLSIAAKKIFPPSAFEGKKALAFCGIARPERFFTLLQEAGIEVVLSLAFPDHHSYPLSSLRKISDYFNRTKADCAITTEKDAVKINPETPLFLKIPLYSMKIELEIEEEFYRRIRTLLEAL